MLKIQQILSKESKNRIKEVMSNGFQKTHKPWQEPENVPQKLRKPQKELQIPNNEGWNKVIKKEV